MYYDQILGDCHTLISYHDILFRASNSKRRIVKKHRAEFLTIEYYLLILANDVDMFLIFNYLNDLTMCRTVNSFKPCFGDHLVISFDVNLEGNLKVISYKRDWRKYSKENLIHLR